MPYPTTTTLIRLTSYCTLHFQTVTDQSHTFADSSLLTPHVSTSPPGNFHSLAPICMLQLFAIFFARNRHSRMPLALVFPFRLSWIFLCGSPLSTTLQIALSLIFLAFGWPINYRPDAFPAPSSSNHSSADRFPGSIDSFLLTEIEHAATARPFTYNHFPTPLQTSLLKTIPKDRSKRRIVLDLSFLPGASVNDGIQKDSFLDEPYQLTLPRSADFVNLIVAKGSGCYLFKKDLKHAYRQIPVDNQRLHLSQLPLAKV